MTNNYLAGMAAAASAGTALIGAVRESILLLGIAAALGLMASIVKLSAQRQRSLQMHRQGQASDAAVSRVSTAG